MLYSVVQNSLGFGDEGANYVFTLVIAQTEQEATSLAAAYNQDEGNDNHIYAPACRIAYEYGALS